MKKSALIIANWEYDDPLLRGLVSPSKDAEALAGVLGDAAIGGFDVQVLTNEASSRVCEETEVFFGDRDRDDLLLFYFSGHGVTDDDGQLYYAARNTHHKRLRSTAVSASWVNDIMNQCRSRRQVMLLDCCHSGAFARTKAGGAVNTGKYFVGSNQEEGRGKFILTACDAYQYSFEGDTVNGAGANSVFTDALIEGLRTGQADLNGDGLISLDELYDYVFRRVRERTPQQTPRKWASDVEGAVVIATNPWPVETPLPEDLQAAIDSFVPDVREKAIPRLEKLLHGRHRGMAMTAHKMLLALVSDDSRRVSTAAERCLAVYAEAFEAERLAAGHAAANQIAGGERTGAQPAGEAGLAAEQAAPGQTEMEQIAARDSMEIAGQSKGEPSLPDATNILSAPAAAEAGRATKDASEAADRSAHERAERERAAADRSAAERAAQAGTTATGGEDPGIPTLPGVTPSLFLSSPSSPAPSSTGSQSRWTSPEERAAQLRAFGRALAGTNQGEARPSQRPSRAETPKIGSNRKQLAAIGGAIAVLILAALGWFFFAGKSNQPSAPVPNPSGQNSPADSANSAVSAPPASGKQTANEKKPESVSSAENAAPGQVPRRVDLSTEAANGLLIAKTAANYPPVAKAAGITGIVVVEAVVNKQGIVQSLRVVSGPPLLQSAALDAMKSWRYRPYLLNGAPVEFRTTESFNFALEKQN